MDNDSSQIWIDHCDFTKAYDGVLDIKGGSHGVTISWCRFLGDDENLYKAVEDGDVLFATAPAKVAVG